MTSNDMAGLTTNHGGVKLRRLLLAACCAALLCAGNRLAGDTPTKVYEVAQRRVRPPGAPRYSDVCFSSRWRRPNTFEMTAAFHATRLDWVYSTDPNWIAECKKRGYHFGGALNSTLPDTPGSKSWKVGRCRDKDGNLVTAPWMVNWVPASGISG